jgi:hypothetical protein
MFQIDSFREGLQEAWQRVAFFVPKFLVFLLILVVGYIVAKIIAQVVERVLERIGFDRAAERGVVRTALERTPYDASDFLAKLVFYLVFLFVLQLAFGVFGPNPVSALLEGVIAYLPKVFAAIVIIVVASAIGAAVRDVVDTALSNLSYGHLLATGAAVAILTVGIFAALDQLEIAENIINALFIAILALVVGSAIIAIGGGGVIPMRAKWEQALRRLETEFPRVQEEASAAVSEAPKRPTRRRMKPAPSDTQQPGPQETQEM